MPDFGKCLKDRSGDIWCWDKESQSVVKLTAEVPDIDEVPREILYRLLKEFAGAGNA